MPESIAQLCVYWRWAAGYQHDYAICR